MKRPTIEQVIRFLKAGGRVALKNWAAGTYLYWKDGTVYLSKDFFGTKNAPWEFHPHDSDKQFERLTDLVNNPENAVVLRPMKNATKEAALVWLELGGKAMDPVPPLGLAKCLYVMDSGRVLREHHCNMFEEGERTPEGLPSAVRWTLLPDTPEQKPEPKPQSLTRLAVIDHLKKGGQVQWRGGIPGTWIARHGMLLWAAQGDVFYRLSTHDCGGQWFADMTDEEIGHLELVPIVEKESKLERFPWNDFGRFAQSFMPGFLKMIDVMEASYWREMMAQQKPAPETPPTPEPKHPTLKELVEHLNAGGEVRFGLNKLLYSIKGDKPYNRWPGEPYKTLSVQYPTRLKLCSAIMDARNRGEKVELLPLKEAEKQEPAPEKSPTRAEITAHLEKGGAVEVRGWDTYKMVDGKPHFWYTRDKQWLPSPTCHDIEELVDMVVVLRDTCGKTITLLPIEKQKPAPITPEQARAHLFKGGKVRALVDTGASHCYWISGGTVLFSAWADESGAVVAPYNNRPPSEWFTESRYTGFELL